LKGTKHLLTRLHGIQPNAAVAFGLASCFAVFHDWSLPEFCWSTWLAGVVYVWACVLSAGIHIILSVRRETSAYISRFPFLNRLSSPVFFSVVVVAALCASLLAFHVYNLMFAFYGIFLSVFAAMEPVAMFGADGFINSDFYTPIFYLIERFWPMAAGLLLAHWKVFTRPEPWKRLLFPLEREFVRLHVMVLALPFFSLMAWLVVRDNYQTITIVMLMGVLYLMPDRQPTEKSNEEKATNNASEAT
jgi:hypothetical protein